jgi:hypothetical protein
LLLTLWDNISDLELQVFAIQLAAKKSRELGEIWWLMTVLPAEGRISCLKQSREHLGKLLTLATALRLFHASINNSVFSPPDRFVRLLAKHIKNYSNAKMPLVATLIDILMPGRSGSWRLLLFDLQIEKSALGIPAPIANLCPRY